MQSLSKLQLPFSPQMDKLVPKFMWKYKGPRVAKMVWKRENKVGGLKLPDFKTYYKLRVMKTVWYQHRKRQFNGTKLRIQT